MVCNAVHNAFLNTLTMGTAFPGVPIWRTMAHWNRQRRTATSTGVHPWSRDTACV